MHQGAYIVGGKKYSRSERRKLTLKYAKMMAKERGLTRTQMFRLRDDMMRAFPAGIPELERME